MKLKPNTTSFSLSKKSVPSGSETCTDFSAKKVLSKGGNGGERRAPEFKLEALKK
jgi:hypothetical protein